MDHQIVSFAFSISWKSKLRNGYSKSIIGDAIAPFIPYEISYRKDKIGFSSPIIDWVKNGMKTFLLDTINSQSFLQCSLIDAGNVKKDVENIIYNDVSFERAEMTWMSLVPFFWESAFLNNSSWKFDGKH